MKMKKLDNQTTVERKLLFTEMQKGRPCPFCNGTHYWIYSDGKECVRCKYFFSDNSLVKD